LIRDRKRVVVYDTLVGVFGLARESMYRHARVVDRFGRAHLRGEDPITAAGIVIAVIAAAAVVAGAVIEIGCANGAWSGGICNWGLGLLLGAGVLGAVASCLIGGCDIILSGIQLVVIPA